ncbi:hypothetical protein ACIQNK_17840 [Streptomyces sp. NPDC091273]|uniref:hypothetical protein n=1 Tax=Streptomyces sp. NPDC091273 TaxID=3365982 RepID=UPI00381C7C0B
MDLALLAAEDVARQGGSRVAVRLDARAPVPASGDPARLERALAKLVDNALRYARAEAVARAAAQDGWAVPIR